MCKKSIKKSRANQIDCLMVEERDTLSCSLPSTLGMEAFAAPPTSAPELQPGKTFKRMPTQLPSYLSADANLLGHKMDIMSLTLDQPTLIVLTSHKAPDYGG